MQRECFLDTYELVNMLKKKVEMLKFLSNTMDPTNPIISTDKKVVYIILCKYLQQMISVPSSPPQSDIIPDGIKTTNVGSLAVKAFHDFDELSAEKLNEFSVQFMSL